MSVTQRLRRDERGVTLIEVLVATALLAIIMVPLGNALIGYIRNSDAVSRRLAESHDIQVSAAYFAQDVQSLGVRDWSAHPYPLEQSIEVNAPATGGLYPCGASGTPDAVVRFAWDDPTDVTRTIRVAYVVVTTGTERQLRRLLCVGSSTPTSDTVLVHNVSQVSGENPTVTCLSPCTDAPAVPRAVRLTIPIREPANDATVNVVLEGQRRQT